MQNKFMKKLSIASILISLIVGCSNQSNRVLKLVLIDETGDKQDAITITCNDRECEEDYDRYFEVIQINYSNENPDIDKALANTYYDVNKKETGYIKNSVNNWKYMLVQCFVWHEEGKQPEDDAWEFDLYFRRYSEGKDGTWVSKSDQEWDELIKATEEMADEGTLRFTVTIDTSIPIGDSKQTELTVKRKNN